MSPWVDPEMWLHCVSIFHVCNLPPFSVFFSFSFTVCFYSKGHSSFRVTALPMFCMDWVFFFLGGQKWMSSVPEGDHRNANEKSRRWGDDDLIMEVLPEGKNWTKFESEREARTWIWDAGVFHLTTEITSINGDIITKLNCPGMPRWRKMSG